MNKRKNAAALNFDALIETITNGTLNRINPSAVFWTCEPCHARLEGYSQTEQAYCPTCREPMVYHGPARRLPGSIDVQAEDVTLPRLPKPDITS